MADCSTYCRPYSRSAQPEYWQKDTNWLPKLFYIPKEDQIQVISRKPLLANIPLNYNDLDEQFITISRDIKVELLDETISIDRRFRQLVSLIEQSKYIMSLEFGWDEENAQPTDPEIWKTAIKFLIHYAADIMEDSERILELPEINPCKDGTIDLSWRTSRARMLINFKRSEHGILAYYYGDFYKNERPVKGWVNTDTVDIYLSMWMRNLAD